MASKLNKTELVHKYFQIILQKLEVASLNISKIFNDSIKQMKVALL